MSIRGHIITMFVATVIAWISWLMVIVNVNPYEATWWGPMLFYVTLFLALFGSLSILGFVVRSVARARKIAKQAKIAVAMRQSLLWSAALISVLALQSQRLLTWWALILVFIVFALIEFFIISLNHHKHQQS